MKKEWICRGGEDEGSIVRTIGLVVSMVYSSLSILDAGTSFGSTIYVDGDGICDGNTPCYTTISAAIGVTSNGDTVYVYSGTYYENVVIDGRIDLIGEDRDAAIIEGSDSGDVVHVSADTVSIREFTIRNSGTTGSKGFWDSGIELAYSDNSEVRSCIFSNNRAGLCLYGCSYNTITNCYFSSNYAGIMFSEIDPLHPRDNLNNEILYNTLQYNSTGIKFEHTVCTHHHSNIIQGNNIFHNCIGIDMVMSQENEICLNEILNNTGYGISLFMCMGGGQSNRFHHNNFISNNGGGVQASDFGGGYDYWYSQIDEEGNYWSDYTGPDMDGDGVGDIPYDIDGKESQDMYPLMNPYPRCGDVNADCRITEADRTYILSYIYFGGGAPMCSPIEACADVNLDGRITGADGTYIINYIYRDGPPPCEPPLGSTPIRKEKRIGR